MKNFFFVFRTNQMNVTKLGNVAYILLIIMQKKTFDFILCSFCGDRIWKIKIVTFQNSHF